MEIAAIIAIVDGALTIFEKAFPALQAAFKSGQIPPAEQQRIRDRYNAIRDGTAFSGPEWSLEP